MQETCPCGSVRGALGNWCPYRDSKYGSKRCLGRTEADRKITSEPWSSKRRSKKNNVLLGLTAQYNHCDECGVPSSANCVSMIFSKSAGGTAPLRKTPFIKNPGVPAMPTLRPCSKSASILDLNLPLSRHD
jgi:hypothetical protein